MNQIVGRRSFRSALSRSKSFACVRWAENLPSPVKGVWFPARRLTEQQWGLIAVAILTIIVVSPAFLVHIPSMFDYPNHVARMHIIVANRTSNIHPFYENAFSPMPNLALDLLVPPLARFLSVEAATKTLFILSEVLIVLGAITLEYT